MRTPELKWYHKNITKYEIETYLESEDIVGRCLLARLRSGTNWLNIEKSRAERNEKKDRIYYMCWEGTEDELHFLRVCNGYKKWREKTERNIHQLLKTTT